MSRYTDDVRALARKYVEHLPDANGQKASKIAEKIYEITRYTLPGVRADDDDSENWDSGYAGSTETTTFVLPKDFASSKSIEKVASPSKDYRKRRNRPGTRREDLYAFDDWANIQAQKSLRERLAYLVRMDPANVKQICKLPTGCNATRWQYEHLRRFVIELNDLVICLRETNACTSTTCPKMNATEKYTFRCAGINGGAAFQCCAVEYMTHTLDSASQTLSSSSHFPVNDRAVISRSSLSSCSSQCRRLYRLFPHAYFHHREIFVKFESERHLLKRFLRFVREFGLVSEKQLVPAISIS